MTINLQNWFQLGPIPADVLIGTYDLKLVALSYLIAVLASYVAINLAGHLRTEHDTQAKFYWLFGGAFTLGAGIWSMHFIGMLAFDMSMPMRYELKWTISSLVVAIVASGFAFYLLTIKGNFTLRMIIGGIFIGFGIATMHYMGMQAMKNEVNIHYLPGLFFLSIVVAILAAEGALILATLSGYGPTFRQFYFKLFSAIVMGIAICGMHYTGMSAAVFTPLAMHNMNVQALPTTPLALFIAGITGLIITLAFTVSTYYKKMIHHIQTEKEFLNTMLDNLEDGIIACDEVGNITVLNYVIEKNIDHYNSNQSIIGISKYFDFYTPDEKTILKGNESPLIRALNGENIHELELIMRYKNGRTRNVIIDGQPIKTVHGRKLGSVVVVHDITELKKNENIKNEFVSVVSHELRTPLTSIRGSLGLLLGGAVGSFSDKASKLLDIANKNCERLLLLINDILDIEKIEAGKMNFELKPVSIEQLVMDSINNNRLYGEKFSVKIKLTATAPDTYVYADPDRLMQVLTNLLSNAIKYSPHGGIVEIAITKDNNNVRVSVSDHGSGIPLDFQARIFQKFSQADSSTTRIKGGTGLGLSISKAILEKLDGTINFVSQLNQGTTFYFELPLYVIETQQIEEPKSVTPSFSNEDKLLICEDDIDQANYLLLLLEAAGLHADICSSVKEARFKLDTSNYQAILLDLILPDQDGISFIRELRHLEKTKNIPIIVLSVIAQTGQSLANGDALSVIDWLEKPINFNKLLEAIARIKNKKNGHIPHVLHVEDDNDTRHVLASVLDKNCIINSASTLKETKNLLSKEKFDLVILDLVLPDGNGIDLLPLFAQYQVPVIVYSATELDKVYSKYVIDALVKSKITNDELLSKIKYIFNELTKDTDYAS